MSNNALASRNPQTLLDRGMAAVAKARTVQELKGIRDKAEAARKYAKQAMTGGEIQNACAEVKLVAERKAGQILAQMKANGERSAGGKPSHDVTVLEDIGVDRKQSSRWQSEAKVPAREFTRYVKDTKAAGGELTSQGLLRVAKGLEQETARAENRAKVKRTKSATAVVGTDTYSTLVVDPPWDPGDEGDVNQFGRTQPTYATMPLRDIERLPVADLATESAHLYLWITNRSLPKGFGLLDAWGFRYITTLTWCKPSIGVGNYYRNNTEHVLFGIRGKLGLLRNDVGTWFEAKRGPKGHSSKPREFYEMVELCSPGPWVELFARSPRQGWASWGEDS